MYPMYPYFGVETVCEEVPITFPPQHQDRQPGLEYLMDPKPIFDNPYYKGSGKLKGKVALITGGDSGIGRAVTVAFAKEGADIAIVYLNEEIDALKTKEVVESLGRQCLLLEGDIRSQTFCHEAVERTVHNFGKLDILINNAAVQFPQKSIMDISREQLEATFQTNIFSFFYMTQAALPYLDCGSTIINTTSRTAYAGFETLIDYSSTKGAIVSFTRSLSLSLVDSGIRVNAVSPGPVWTPLTTSSLPAEAVKTFGASTPMKRAAQPFELAPAYVYLACDDSSFVTGQVIHVNGGAMVTS